MSSTIQASFEVVPELRFEVHHLPQPQGSKRAFVRGGRAIIVDDNPKTRGFRDAVTIAAIEARRLGEHVTHTGPVSVVAVFTLPRPQGHYGTGANTHRLRPGAPRYPATAPDVDKLLRAVLDGLTDAAAFRDDSRVVSVATDKVYPHSGPLALPQPGALIIVREVT